jgi:hypothetical protein
MFLDNENYSKNIQVCRSSKQVLLYLSKEDKAPYLHNVSVSRLPLFARAWYHAKKTYTYPQPVNKVDAFIVSCGQNSRFAISTMEQQIEQVRQRKNQEQKKYEPNHRCNITSTILLALQGPKHVYIQGEPGLGKTEIIDNFLAGKKYWKAGEPSDFLLGTLPEQTEFIWFEDFDIVKYHGNLNNLLSLMDHKETSVSKKCQDDKIITTKAKFIFTSNFTIGSAYSMFNRRIEYIHVCHKMYDCHGCRPDYIPNNQLGLFSLNGEQLLVDLSLQNNTDFTLDLSDENARQGPPSDGLHNIMTQEEIEKFFDTM